MSDESVQVKFTADISQLKSGAEAAAAAVKAAADQMSASFQATGSAAGAFGGLLKTALDGAVWLEFKQIAEEALHAVEIALKDTVGAAENFGISVAMFAKMMGSSETEAAGLSAALKIVGSSAEDYERMVMRMEMRLKTQEATWKSYGMATRDANGTVLEGIPLMEAAAAAMQKYKSGTDQNEFALSVFGRGAKEIYTILRANADLQKKATDVMKEWGLVASGAGHSAEDLEAQAGLMNLQWEAMSIAIGQKLMPVITGIIDTFRSVSAAVKDVIGSSQAWEYVWTPLEAVIKTVWDAVMGFGKSLIDLSNSTGITWVATKLLEAAWIAIKVALDGAALGISAISAVLQVTAEYVEEFANKTKAMFIGIAQMIVDFANHDATKMKADWEGMTQAWEDSTRTHAANIVTIMQTTMDNINRIMGNGPAPIVVPPPKDDATGGGSKHFTPPAKKGAGNEARKEADEKLQEAERVSLAMIQIQAAENAELYRMGQEGVAEFEANARKELDDKYKAERDYLTAKAAADSGNKLLHQKDLDDLKLLDMKYGLDVVKIANDTANKLQAIQDKQFGDFERSAEDRLKAGQQELDQEYADHKITADQKHDLEVALTREVETEILARFDAEHASLVKGSLDWQNAYNQRAAIVRKFNADVAKEDTALVNEERQKWTTLSNSISSTFKSAIDGMLFQGKTFGQGMAQIATGVLQAFANMGEQMLANWITTLVADLFETNSTQAAKGGAGVTSNAGIAASAAIASTAAIPIIGPELAPAAGAAAFAEAMAYMPMASFAVGAWDIPSDMTARIHKGEMVIPATFAEGMRDGGGMGGGDTHISVTLNGRYQNPQEDGRKIALAISQQVRLNNPHLSRLRSPM